MDTPWGGEKSEGKKLVLEGVLRSLSPGTQWSLKPPSQYVHQVMASPRLEHHLSLGARELSESLHVEAPACFQV